MEKQLKVSEVKLIYKSKIPVRERLSIKCSEDSYNIFKSTWDEYNIGYIEEFKILLLNRSNKALGIAQISSGGMTGTVIDTKIIMTYALKGSASGIILCHNHPSGNLKPSEADKSITSKIAFACKTLDMSLLDHIIITPDNGYFSFADEGILL